MSRVETPKHEGEKNKQGSDIIQKLCLVTALYVSFLFSGIYEEKLYKETYQTETTKVKFSHPSIAIMANSIIAYLISSVVLLTMGTPKNSPFQPNDKPLLGAYYMLSRITAENSLKYLDFISKIIGKSCKSVAIILIYFLYNVPYLGTAIKKLINQKKEEKGVHTHGFGDLIKVVITTLSIILFNLEDNSSSKEESSTLKSILLGYGLLALSLVFDALVGLKEKIIHHEVHHNPIYSKYSSRLSWEYMSLFSVYSVVFCFVVLAYQYFTSDLMTTLHLYFSQPELVKNLVYYSITASMGQVVIFQFLEKYGPLKLSIFTGVRKILSIALSIIIFGKAVSLIKIISLVLGTTVIAWEIFEKAFSGTKTQEKKE